VWIGYRTNKGYGQFKYRIDGVRRTARAHRAAWEHANGPIPDGLHVLHTCDNPACVNIEHLYLGTNDDNIADKMDRHPRFGLKK